MGLGHVGQRRHRFSWLGVSLYRDQGFRQRPICIQYVWIMLSKNVQVYVSTGVGPRWLQRTERRSIPLEHQRTGPLVHYRLSGFPPLSGTQTKMVTSSRGCLRASLTLKALLLSSTSVPTAWRRCTFSSVWLGLTQDLGRGDTLFPSGVPGASSRQETRLATTAPKNCAWAHECWHGLPRDLG